MSEIIHESVCEQSASDKDSAIGKIRTLFPAKNALLQLANDEVAKWFKPYRPNRLGNHYGKGDHFAGKDVVFEWEYVGRADYFVLEIAEKGDYNGCLRYRTTVKKVSVGELNVLADYAWRVTAYQDGKKVAIGESCFSTEKSPASIVIDGVSNARDVAFFSKTVRQGMIYRSASLDEITEKGLSDALSKYKIKTEIDLRNTGEGKQSPLGDKVNYYSLPGAYYVSSGASVKDSFYRQNMAKAIGVFAYESNYPILFHCAIGRDRTGTLAAVIEAFLGAEYDDIMADYEMSFFSEAGCKDGAEPDIMFSKITEIYDFLSEYGEDTLQENTAKFLRDSGVTSEELENIRRIMKKEKS